MSVGGLSTTRSITLPNVRPAVLVPVAGGPNSRRAVLMATTMASLAEEGPAKVTVLRVVRQGSSESDIVRAHQDMAHSVEGINYEFNLKVAEGNDVVQAILDAAAGYDLIVIGASNEPLFKTLLVGNIPEQVALKAKVTTIMVKRRHGPVKSALRETVLQPASRERTDATEPNLETEVETSPKI